MNLVEYRATLLHYEGTAIALRLDTDWQAYPELAKVFRYRPTCNTYWLELAKFAIRMSFGSLQIDKLGWSFKQLSTDETFTTVAIDLKLPSTRSTVLTAKDFPLLYRVFTPSIGLQMDLDRWLVWAVKWIEGICSSSK